MLEFPTLKKFQMQSGKMAARTVTILLALLMLRAQADEFTLWDALQSNGYVQHNILNYQIFVPFDF
jgi:hypothetical protein